MSARRVSFIHDGHQFEAMERESGGGALAWAVTMDGAPALEFAGEFPYRDPDVMKRVVEWYEIQKPRR